MAKRTRRTHNPAFKAKVALAAVKAWVRGHYAHVEGVGAGKPAESLGFGRGRRSKRPQNLDTRLHQDTLVN
jgi:hypothetical protein